MDSIGKDFSCCTYLVLYIRDLWTLKELVSCFFQKLARVKAEVRKREESIKEKQQFLDNEIENNKEQEKKISIAERISAKTRIDFQEAETQRVQFQDEVRPDVLS